MARNSFVFYITIILSAAILITGCSGLSGPTSPAVSEFNAVVQEAGDFSDNHFLWGFWWINFSPDLTSWEIAPSRDITFHANVRKFLEDGVPCDDCLKILHIESSDHGTKLVDIQIRHPWPGLDLFTGYDVRGIAMWNGSEVWPASGLRTQDPDSTDGYVLNADGCTTIFNPTDFPPGWAPQLISYSQGKFATSTFPDSTLNPYMDYYTEPINRSFGPGEVVIRQWDIRFPTGGPFVLGYAIDASWENPESPADPHKIEPYMVSVIPDESLEDFTGSTVNLRVRVWDWQDDPGGVWIECPELWSGEKTDYMTVHGDEYTDYYIHIINETNAAPGEYRALIAAKDSINAPPPHDLTMYIFYDIPVAEASNHPPTAVAEASAYSVVVGEDITFTSLSTDPDGPDDINSWKWDFENDGTWDTFDENPTWDYPLSGTYFVDHEVMDQGGLTDNLEPDDLLVITINLDCCLNPPVAQYEPIWPIITDETLNLVSTSYDPDGIECTIQNMWDIDNNGTFDFGGDSFPISSSIPGIFYMGLKATDPCDMEDTIVIPIDIHVGVTQPEDQDYKTHNTLYSYVSADYSPDDAAFAVDITDSDGPWDFPQLTLTDIGNNRAILDVNHPEVASFKDDFTIDFTPDHFYKTEGIFNFVSGAAYIAETYETGTDPDYLLWIGIHESEDIGSVPLNPPMTQPYPFWIYSVVDYTFGFPPLFSFDYHMAGWGEGLVTVPYGGISNEPCFVLKYEVAIDSPDVSGGALVYEWYLDDGTVVAIVAAINSGADINYDPDTLEITGIATFNALNTVGPY